jgi:hypothetical protein
MTDAETERRPTRAVDPRSARARRGTGAGAPARAVSAVLRALVIALIGLYQGLSSMTPACCRYHPTCSRYGLEAVRTHGALRGGWLTLRRILSCRPGGGWGYDPVPPPAAERTAAAHADPAPVRTPAGPHAEAGAGPTDR